MERDEIRQKIFTSLEQAHIAGLDPSKISEDSKLKLDLGLDSVDLLEYVWQLEEAFGISISDDYLGRITTVGDAIDVVAELKNNGQAATA